MSIFEKLVTEVLVITRFFDSTPEKVFNAWTDPNSVMQWWGPKGFTCPVCRIDFKIGGEYFFCMRSPYGEDYWSKGVYKLIQKNERLVMTDSFSDASGNIISASSVGLPGNWPSTLLIRIDFQDYEGKTKFTLVHEGLPQEVVNSCSAGWNESLDKLARMLEFP